MAFCQGIFRKLPPRVNTPFVPKTVFFAYFKQMENGQIIMFTQTECTQKPNKKFIIVKIKPFSIFDNILQEKRIR